MSDLIKAGKSLAEHIREYRPVSAADARTIDDLVAEIKRQDRVIEGFTKATLYFTKMENVEEYARLNMRNSDECN